MKWKNADCEPTLVIWLHSTCEDQKQNLLREASLTPVKPAGVFASANLLLHFQTVCGSYQRHLLSRHLRMRATPKNTVMLSCYPAHLTDPNTLSSQTPCHPKYPITSNTILSPQIAYHPKHLFILRSALLCIEIKGDDLPGTAHLQHPLN